MLKLVCRAAKKIDMILIYFSSHKVVDSLTLSGNSSDIECESCQLFLLSALNFLVAI